MQKNERTMRRLAMVILVLLLCSLAPCALARSYSLGDEAAEVASIQEALEALDSITRTSPATTASGRSPPCANSRSAIT